MKFLNFQQETLSVLVCRIIVSLKRFRDLFKNSSLHNVQVIIDNFGSILDADTQALIDLRRSYCKILVSIQHLPFLRGEFTVMHLCASQMLLMIY